ncbi:MAG: TRAP transporter small permease subunit [Gemmatimonadetes bacterium]|nr:TRAP transporter small permease subunit [Gemmatimonadota bacterium]MBI2614281.1 TRAP transporter small permease subunit [Gemmatimonadota bacterium]
MTGAAGALVRVRAGVERALEWTVMLLMAALATAVIVAVIFRKAGAALVWYDEVAAILLAWLTFYGAGLAALKRAHIGFPRLVQGLSRRSRGIAVVVRELAVLGFLAAVAIAGWQVTVGLRGTYLVSLPGIPRALAASAVPLGALVCMVAELLSAFEWRAGLSAPEREGAP